MQWSIRRAMDDAVFAWLTLPVSILISALLFAVLSVNHFSEIASIIVPFGVMCIILAGAHALRHRSDVLVPLAKKLIGPNVLQAKTRKLSESSPRFLKERQRFYDPRPPLKGVNISDSEERISIALPADQQLTLTVLAQATQFLFDELGRRLNFWLKKKGEQATPKSVEPVSRPDGVAMKLDDLERQIDVQRLLLKKGDIEASMGIIRTKKRTLNALCKQVADPLTPLITKANIEAVLPELEEEIEQESGRLEALLREGYGESSA